MTESPAILVLDIETAPILANVWGLWEQNISLDMIHKDSHMLSYAAKWLEKPKIYYEDQSKRRNMEDDKHLCLSLHKLLDKADIVLVQNGASFDLPIIKTRMLFHDIPPFSPVRVIDTLKIAKSTFRFTSNKLQHLSAATHAGIQKDKHHNFPGFELWKECLLRNPKAWAEMKKYNIADILSLEEVYLKMRPWIKTHPNLGIWDLTDRPVCPKCGENALTKSGFAYLQAGIFIKYHCKSCRGWSRGKKNVMTRTDKLKQLTNG